MPPTYDEAGLTYDEVGLLFDGIPLRDLLTLLIDGVDTTGLLATKSLTITAGTHGNSLGTLTAWLNDPLTLPEVEQSINFYVGNVQRFIGLLKAVEAQEIPGGEVYLFVKLDAQDSGPGSVLPTAPPFNLSDAPDGVTTKGYKSLTKSTRTTEGGAPKTTYKAGVHHAGLWAGMNIEVTSASYGLVAAEMSIVEISVSFPGPMQPAIYSLTLGEPLVKLDQLLTSLPPNLTPGSITATEISDGAISTPKIAANAITTEKLSAAAVIANVLNVGGTVDIDAAGIRVINGAIIVENSGATVIIDGTSNIFKIVATGTIVTAEFTAPLEVNSTIEVTTGLNFRPANLCFLDSGDGAKVVPYLLPSTFPGASPTEIAAYFECWVDDAAGATASIVRARTRAWSTGTFWARTYRYNIFKEIAF